MKKASVVVLVLISFLGGFFAGRKFPAHHYVRYERAGLLFDTVTGKLCNPAPDPQHILPSVPACGE